MSSLSRLGAMDSHASILTVVVLAVCAAGCALLEPNDDLDYKTVIESPNRDQRSAQAKTERAIEVYESGNLDRAERLLQEALRADVTYGPAHNTLGTLYFDQQKFYLAAWEFQYVINLMPDRPEPHNNLGLVLEAVGKLDLAIQSYQTAVELDPDNPIYLGNSIRASFRRGSADWLVRQQLEHLIFVDTRPDWVAWAHERLALESFDGDGEGSLPSSMPGSETLPLGRPENQQELLPPPSTSGFTAPPVIPRSQINNASILQPSQRPLLQPPGDPTLH